MKKLAIISFFLITVFGFSQTKNRDYEIFSAVLNQELNIGNKNTIDSILVIKQFEDDDDRISGIDYIVNREIENDVHYFYSQPSDTIFIKRYLKDPNLKKTLLGFAGHLENHPSIDPKLFRLNNVHIEMMSLSKYKSFFKKKYNRIDKGWARIKKKYNTRRVIAFSNVFYNGNLAALYYEEHCGGLCGSGNVVLLEEINGRWKVLVEINLWVS